MSCALAIQRGTNVPVIYYLCKDHLGSITGIMNSNGDLLEEYNYDPWGRRRNPADWSYSNVAVPTGISNYSLNSSILITVAFNEIYIKVYHPNY